MSCQFSAPFAYSNRNVCLSPSSKLLASAVGSNVSIRDMNTLEIVHMFTCVDKVETMQFSPDSEYLLCGMFARCAIQVFSMADPGWKCRINESVAGVTFATWAPDSRHILVLSDFGIQLAIWSLIESMSYLITSPKTESGNISFSDCGRYLAVGHRLECKDHIGVYAVNPWQELNKFRSRTNDMVSLHWTPGGTHIVAQDSHLNYRIVVYTPSGEVLSQYEAYQNALGIRSMSFHRPAVDLDADGDIVPSLGSPLVAIGSYDGNARLLSTHSWNLAFVLPATHLADMMPGLANDVTTTVEVLENDESTLSTGFDDAISLNDTISSSFSTKRSKSQAGKLGTAYMSKSLKALPRLSTSAQVAKAEISSPKFGVSWLGWSPEGNLLAMREESQPRCLWVWHALEAQLCALLVQMDSVVCARWRPTLIQEGNESNSGVSTPVLAFVCNTPRVYFWTPTKSSWADLPASKMSTVLTKSKQKSEPAFKSQKARKSSAASTVSSTISGGGNNEFVQLNAIGLKWTGDGKRLLVLGKDRFCSCDISFKEDNSATIELNENN